MAMPAVMNPTGTTGDDEQRPMLPMDVQGWHRKARPTLSEEQRASAVLWLAVLCAAALGLRLLIFALGPMAELSHAMDPASARYVALAHSLAEDQTFGLDAAADTGLPARVSELRIRAGELPPPVPHAGPTYRAETYLTPGYPAFLAVFSYVGLTGHAVLLVQCILGAVCVWLVYRLTLELLDSPRAALLAAAIMALHPAAVAATNVVLPDVLWITLVLAGLCLVVASEKNPTGSMAIGGLLLGLAALVQPYALVLLTLLALWACARRRNLQTIAAAVVMLIAAAAPAGLWAARNHALGHGAHLSTRPVIDRYFLTLADLRTAADQDGSADALAADLLRHRAPDETVMHAMDRLATVAIHDASAGYLAMLERNARHLFTDHSLETMYRQLGIGYEPPAVNRRILTSGLAWREYVGTGDDATLGAALTWTAMNTLLLLATVVGLVLMLVRGKGWAVILYVGLLAVAIIELHSAHYGRPQLAALAVQAAIVGGILTRGRPRPPKTRKTREQKRLEKARRRQEQCLGVSEDIATLPRTHDPIIPGQGPREGIRPI